MGGNLFDDVTEFLKINGLTYKWLIERLKERNIIVDKVSMSKWAHGVQLTDKASVVHNEALSIIRYYEANFAERIKKL